MLRVSIIYFLFVKKIMDTLEMCVAKYSMSNLIIWNAFVQNVYHRLVCYISYETSRDEEQECLTELSSLIVYWHRWNLVQK